MGRRTLLISIAGATASGACTPRDGTAEDSGRPTLAVDADGPGRWRIRSWRWQADAWRPLIARARLVDGAVEFVGEIDAADRAEVIARLRVRPSTRPG